MSAELALRVIKVNVIVVLECRKESHRKKCHRKKSNSFGEEKSHRIGFNLVFLVLCEFQKWGGRVV